MPKTSLSSRRCPGCDCYMAQIDQTFTGQHVLFECPVCQSCELIGPSSRVTYITPQARRAS